MKPLSASARPEDAVANASGTAAAAMRPVTAPLMTNATNAIVTTLMPTTPAAYRLIAQALMARPIMVWSKKTFSST
jgi:hypothetical protein